MLAETYAQALIGLSEKADSGALLGVLKRKGHMALLPSIVREYEKLAAKRAAARAGELRVAQRADVEMLQEEIAKYAAQMEISLPHARVAEDPTIVGGFILSKGEREVDASYKTRLLELYQRLMRVRV